MDTRPGLQASTSSCSVDSLSHCGNKARKEPEWVFIKYRPGRALIVRPLDNTRPSPRQELICRLCDLQVWTYISEFSWNLVQNCVWAYTCMHVSGRCFTVSFSLMKKSLTPQVLTITRAVRGCPDDSEISWNSELLWFPDNLYSQNSLSHLSLAVKNPGERGWIRKHLNINWNSFHCMSFILT